MKKEPLPGGVVLLKPIGSHMEPYTTADTVAQYAQELIRKHRNDLEEFGLLRFEMEAVERERGMRYEAIKAVLTGGSHDPR